MIESFFVWLLGPNLALGIGFLLMMVRLFSILFYLLSAFDRKNNANK